MRIALIFGMVAAVLTFGREAAAQETTSPFPPISWKVEFKPVLTGDVPFSRGDRLLSENSTLLLGLSTTFDWGQDLEVTASGGATFTNDYGPTDKDGTGLSAGLKFASKHTLWNFKPSLSYGLEAAYDDGFSPRTYTDHTVTLAAARESALWKLCKSDEDPDVRTPVNACTGATTLGYKIEPSISVIYSDDDTRERVTPQIMAGVFGFVGRDVRWDLDFTAQARLFKDPDPLMTERREDFRYTTYAGFDFARALFPNTPAVKTLKLGVRWVLNESNAPDGDFNRAELAPVLTLTSTF